MQMNKWLWLLAAWVASFLLMKLEIGVAMFGVIFIPVIALVMAMYSWSRKQHAAAVKVADDFGGQFKYSHMAGPSGIAIDPERQILRLRSGADTKKPLTKDYPFSDVRDFEKVILSGGQFRGQHSAGPNMQSAVGASMANLGVAAQNARLNRENQKASGIFITVKDIDNPKWRVAFADEKGMDRWMEILRQSIVD